MLTFTNVGCILEANYKPTMVKKQQYLGGTTRHTRRNRFNVVLQLITKSDRSQFFSFWKEGLNYGNDPFMITLPIFGFDAKIPVTIENDLSENVKNEASEITLDLVQINNEEVGVIQGWQRTGVEVVVAESFTINADDDASVTMIDLGESVRMVILSVEASGVTAGSLAYDVELSSSKGTVYKSVYNTENMIDPVGFRVDITDHITAKVTNYDDEPITPMKITISYILL